MLGFKDVGQMSLEECAKFLAENKDDFGYEDVKARYEELVEQIKQQEEADFRSCKTIADYDAFEAKYSSLLPYFSALYLQKSQQSKASLIKKIQQQEEERRREEQLRKEEKRRKKKRILIMVVTGLIVTSVVVFFVGYKPVNSLSVENLTFGKEGGTKGIHISTNVSSDAIMVEQPSKGWSSVDFSGTTIKVTANANPDDNRSCSVVVKAYSTFYGNYVGTPMSQTVTVSQKSGLASSLEVGKASLKIGKTGETNVVSVKTDGVKLALSSNVNWIHCECYTTDHNDQYYHDDTYKIVVDLNNTSNRSGKVLVETGGLTKEIVVNQESGLATRFSVDRSTIGMVSKTGNNNNECYRVGVSTDGTTWEVTSSCSWLHITKYSGFFEIVVSSNSGEVRTGYVYASSNNGHRETITVNQDGNPTSFYASRSSRTFDTGSDYEYIGVTNNSNQTVYVSTDRSWLSASMYGSDVKVSCSSNNSSPRDGTVTLTCGDKRTTISVHQKGYKYVDCPNCMRDMWGKPMGKVFVGFGTPWGHWELCGTCGGSGSIKKKMD